MSQTSYFTMRTSSELVEKPHIVVDEIAELAPWETMLLTLIGFDSLSRRCESTEYKYLEIQQRPARTTLNGAVSAGETTFTFDDAIVAAGDLFVVNEEVVEAGTPDATNKIFSDCTRNKGIGADAAHADGDYVLVLGQPRVEGRSVGTTSDLAIQPDTITTYTQIFSLDEVVSGTAQAVRRLGISGSEFDEISMGHMQLLKRYMEGMVQFGYDVAAATNATAGQFNSLYERVQPINHTDMANQSLGMNNVRDASRAVRDWGGILRACLTNFYQSDVFDALGPNHIQHVVGPMDSINMRYGVNVSRLRAGGSDIAVLPSDMNSAVTFFLDSDMLGFGPLNGAENRALQFIPLAKNGDNVRGQVLGEYTFEVRCPRSHYAFASVKYK